MFPLHLEHSASGEIVSPIPVEQMSGMLMSQVD